MENVGAAVARRQHEFVFIGDLFAVAAGALNPERT